MRWVFGAEPLDQTVVAADLLRRVTGLVLAAEGEHPAVDRLVTALREVEAELADVAPVDLRPRVGAGADADGRLYLDHSRDIGAYNPSFPEYAITVDGDRAWGSATFPVVYEGPPGIVHGGFLGVLFDCVVQHHNCDLGVAGKTTSMTVRFKRPTPLLIPLGFEVERRVEGRRITSTARLTLGDDPDHLLAEAEVMAVAGDLTNLPEASPRRTPS